MVRTMKTGMGLVVLAAAFALQAPARAQDSTPQDKMPSDSMKQDNMGDKMMHEGMAKTLFTGKFHGKVHKTEGRATVYQEGDVSARETFYQPESE